MAVLSLPLSFKNSFWSQDYRSGLEVLFAKLEQGVTENDEIVAFIMARAVAENQLAAVLMNPALTGASEAGFGADDGASLLIAFHGLQAESVAQGQVHKSIAHELQTLVAEPFHEWSQEHKKRLRERKKAFVEVFFPAYEQVIEEVSKLKQQYLAKIRRADEADDDAKFAPNRKIGDKYTSSPLLRPHDRAPPQRTASVSERISQRLKEIQSRTFGNVALSEEPKGDDLENAPQKVDKGKGRAVDSPEQMASPPAMSPPLPPAKIDVDVPTLTTTPPPASPIILAGVSLPPSAVSRLLVRAAAELPLRPVRFPLLGEYPDCFTGDEFVTWLKDSVPDLSGNLDRAEDFARDIAEQEGLLRRIGEFGNQFDHSDDAFYQFRPKAFKLEDNVEVAPSSPMNGMLPTETLLKRTGTIVNYVTQALNTQSEPAHIKARQDAEAADQAYRVAVRNLDRQRLGLEDKIEDTLKVLQKWETDRLRAVKSALLQYQGTLANLPKFFEPSIQRSGTLVASFHTESDLIVLMERYRTGPFRPEAHLYESVSHDESDVVFGIDLRKWADGGWAAISMGEEKKDLVPPVLTALLQGLEAAYGKQTNDAEKRKAWIYEVPLPIVHHLREALNSVPAGQPIPAELLAKYDAPALASGLKLWILELNPPLALWEGWEEFRKLYPTVGAAKPDAQDPQEHIQDLKGALQKLPKIHLYVLDLILKHLKTLIESTTAEESNEVYITKLALSVGRTIIRPRYETEMSIQDRHPTLLFIDLLKNYDAILPSTIANKKRDSGRKMPIRKRTAPVDMRLSRSRISVDADPRQLLVAQQVAQNPTLARKALSPERSPHSRPSPVKHVPGETVSPSTEGTAPAHVVEPVLVAPPVSLSAPAPPVHEEVTPRPAFKEPLPEDEDLPPRPAFKEPPPEDEDLPPRPTFREPLPEDEDLQPRSTFTAPSPGEHEVPPHPVFREPPPEEVDLPTRPAFKEPPPEVDDLPPRPTFVEPAPEVEETVPVIPPVPAPVAVAPDPKPSPPPVVPVSVTPPTPQAQGKLQSNVHTRSGSSGSVSSSKDSQSTSPNQESLNTTSTPLSRTSLGQIRGPRSAKGPRSPSGTSVNSLVANLNRNSVSGSPSPPPTAPNRPTSPPRRTSMWSKGPFARRTMASDAEDNVVDRK